MLVADEYVFNKLESWCSRDLNTFDSFMSTYSPTIPRPLLPEKHKCYSLFLWQNLQNSLALRMDANDYHKE